MPPDNTPNLEKVLNDISAELPKLNDRIKQAAEQANTEIKNLGKVTDETKVKADQLLTQQGEIDARLKAAEQKLARAGSGGAERPKTLGETVVADEAVKAMFGQAGRGRAQVQVNRGLLGINAALTSITTDTTGAAGDLVRPDRVAGVVTPPERRMTIRDLVMPGTTESNAVEYAKETGFTNNARVVTEAAAKPETTLKFDLSSVSVVTIAHWVKASKQILADAKMLRSHVDGRLRYGLAYAEEQELLMGSGTTGNINGIYTQATAADPAFSPDAQTGIDVIRLAILQAMLAEYPVDGIVLNPTDWARMELEKDGENRYIIGNPMSMLGPRLWGRPVIETQAMIVDKFLVGAFKLGAQIFDREQASVVISTEDGDNFIKNMVTILAEERLALAVYRPEAFIKGDLGNVT
jgi:HK97 family phage major capsid protein